ncbi:MAG: hypothetical protein HKL85_01235 [Acidimicrobiaceae bacterium]|jgi:hypothetical protein|nr:hypothetical protein [Acidimicrobiaceae bacterium]
MTPEISPMTKVQGIIDDALRAEVSDLVGEFEVIPSHVILGDWTMVLSWIDPDDGSNFYTSLNSKNLAHHARVGLLYQGLEDDE